MFPGAPPLQKRAGKQTEEFLRLHTWPRGRGRGPGATWAGREREEAGPGSGAGRSLPGKASRLFLTYSFIQFVPMCGLGAGPGAGGAGRDQTHGPALTGLRRGQQGKGEVGSDRAWATGTSGLPLPAMRSHWRILSLQETRLDLHFKRMVWATVWRIG